LVSVKLSSVIEDCEAREFPRLILGLFIFILLLTLLLYGQELFIIDAPPNLPIFNAVAPVFEYVAGKLSVGIVAVQTAAG